MKLIYAIEPWSCLHQSGKSQIEAYIPAADQREVIAECFSTVGPSAKSIAEFITQAVNTLDERENMIDELVAAVEICLACEGLTWEAEHDAELALRHAKGRARL